ncbi:keratin-associated protein 13-2-like [Ochotona princeps]|uniref:keratin-associated protein 13-2-like n=1 Tax=Ochotona princeps TaxID=9978 RepID=UPI00271534A7|nr:keratin-associated protein 13-2-like [Ochotona princeps]
MSSNCCARNFSSRSFGSSLLYPTSSCTSYYPSSLIHSSDLCFPSNYQMSSSLYSDCHETCFEPTGCQPSCMASSPCQTSCYRLKTSRPCSPYETTYPVSLGFGSSSSSWMGYGSKNSCSLGYGSRSCYFSGRRPSCFKSLGSRASGFPSLGYGSEISCPTALASGSCQSACYTPSNVSSYCRPTC